MDGKSEQGNASKAGRDEFGNSDFEVNREDSRVPEADTEKQDSDYDKVKDAYKDVDFDPQDQEKPVKLHVPFWVIGFLALVILLDIICMIRFPKVLSDYKIYAMAEEKINNSETGKAIGDLYTLALKHTDSVPIMIRTVKLSMESGYYDVAGYIIDEYLSGKNVSDSEYILINGYYTKLEQFYATSDAINQIFNTQNQEVLDEDYYENVRAKLKSLQNQEGQDKALVYYSLGITEADMETAKNDLLECYKSDPECYDVRAQLSIVYRRLGELANAKQIAGEALRKDKNDSTALRAMSTIALVEGNLEQGLTYAKAAYDSYPDGIYIRETYLIALTLNGQTEQAQLIKEEMQGAGEILEEDTLSLLNGEISLQDYYIGE